MDDVRRDALGPPHGTTPAAVIANKLKLRSLKGSEHIDKNSVGPYRGFGYLSQREIRSFCNFQQDSRYKD